MQQPFQVSYWQRYIGRGGRTGTLTTSANTLAAVYQRRAHRQALYLLKVVRLKGSNGGWWQMLTFLG